MKPISVVILAGLVFGAVSAAGAQEEPAAGVLDAKVTDVAIFKGGSGIFRFEGEGVVKDGRLVLKDAPKPAFGTLWFYALDDGVTVASVNSREVEFEEDRRISGTWELVTKNTGKHARVVMKDGEKSPEGGIPKDWEIEGTIISVSPQKEVFLETEMGVIACAVKDMRYAVIEGAETTEKTKKKRLDMYVALRGAADGRKVRVGYSCLQTGIKWLPAYRMDLSDGKARLALSASVINDAVNIAASRASFVVGQPLFTLAKQLSPVAQENVNIDLREFDAQAGTNVYYWDAKPDLEALIASNTAQVLKEQARQSGLTAEGAARSVRAGIVTAAGEQLGGEYKSYQAAGQAGETAEAWHLFYYTAEDVSVEKNTSSDVVLWSEENPVENLFVWSVAPPRPYQNPDYARRLRAIYTGGLFKGRTVEDKGGTEVRYEEARPPMHCLKMTNKTGHPWASAPLLVYEQGRALGQVWLLYTPANQDTQVVIGPSPDILTHKAHREVRRDIGAHEDNKVKFDLVTIEGFLKIENKRAQKAQVEAKVELAGTPVAYDNNAEVTTHRDSSSGLNPATTIKWTVNVEPGKEKVLTYTYNVYVRH